MRILYGVNGYGRGHATRALAVLAELRSRHELLVLAGGDAYDAMHRDYPVARIPTLGYSYRAAGTRSNWLTFKHNAPAVLDLLLRGAGFQMVRETFEDFQPDATIVDAEPWSAHVARRLRIPRISFDHFGIMAYCRPPMSARDRLLGVRDVAIYRALMGEPERVIVSSFYSAPPRRPGVQVVGTLLRREVLPVRPQCGAHLLVYLNKGVHLFSPRVEHALRELDCPVRVYGTRRVGASGNLEYRPPANLTFLEDLATCRAVVSTAGNQLVGEALHLAKPLLVMPEDCVEQRVNALAIERMGVGISVAQPRFSHKVIREFLAREAEFAARARGAARDGRRDAVDAIERSLSELVAPPAAAPRTEQVA